MERYTFSLTSGIHAELKQHAEATGVAMSEHLRQAIERYLQLFPCPHCHGTGYAAASGNWSFAGRS